MLPNIDLDVYPMKTQKSFFEQSGGTYLQPGVARAMALLSSCVSSSVRIPAPVCSHFTGKQQPSVTPPSPKASTAA